MFFCTNKVAVACRGKRKKEGGSHESHLTTLPSIPDWGGCELLQNRKGGGEQAAGQRGGFVETRPSEFWVLDSGGCGARPSPGT